jgi:hypothetical protein
MAIICGAIIGFFLGYFICMVLASIETQLAVKRDEKTSSFYRKILDEQQLTIDKQTGLISQLVEDKLILTANQHLLKAEMTKLRQQHERTLSALN